MAFVSVTASVACKMNRKEVNIFSLLINSFVFIQKTSTPDLTSCTSGKNQKGGGGNDLPPIWQYSPKVFKCSVPFSFLRQYDSINMKSWILLILNKLSGLAMRLLKVVCICIVLSIHFEKILLQHLPAVSTNLTAYE